MKGDFTRDTFNVRNHFSRVLMQQGRVQLDADWNEQVSILLNSLWTLAADLIGPYGGPPWLLSAQGKAIENHGFRLFTPKEKIGSLDGKLKEELEKLLATAKPQIILGRGCYYVDGIRVENSRWFPLGELVALETDEKSYLAYLDVWERHVSYAEMEDLDGSTISVREVALGGPDTATRAKIVWQVKVQRTVPPGASLSSSDDVHAHWQDWVGLWQSQNRGLLKATAFKGIGTESAEPCIIRPESRYRGPENQLYRVEIHNGGKATDPEGKGNGASFKWSRENGSVIFPVEGIETSDGQTTVSLRALGPDTRYGLKIGDWVEILDDNYTLRGTANPLSEIQSIEPSTRRVTVKPAVAGDTGTNQNKHPILRRWDQRATAISKPSEAGVPIVEGEPTWLDLEDGIKVQFQPGATYRSGDYWLIPARVATGDVEWPGGPNNPLAQPPDGVEHHYAPLLFVNAKGEVISCRRTFVPLAK